MTPDEYAADITKLDHADDMPDLNDWQRIHEDWKLGKCYNCGTWAIEGREGEYECPNCGDTWDIYEPPPDIP